MKALSVRQPWASLIACGRKTIECRTWKTSYRGELLICSGKNIDSGSWAREFLAKDLDFPRGFALCVVELLEIRPMTRKDCDFACVTASTSKEDLEEILKGYAWMLRLCRRISPFPVKGWLNLFSVPEDML